MPRLQPNVWIVACAAALALTACHGPPLQRPGGDQTQFVYVVRRSWHIDIGFQASDLQPPLTSLGTQFPTARYLGFGFGDRHYLMSKHRGAGTLLSALWPGQGLILMTALTASPDQAFGAANVIELRVSAAQSLRIQQFIWDTINSEQGPVAPLAPGPYEGSVFYAAVSRYSALHTCNTWAAESLHSAPLAIRSAGVELAGQLWSQAQRLQRTQASGTVP